MAHILDLPRLHAWRMLPQHLRLATPADDRSDGYLLVSLTSLKALMLTSRSLTGAVVIIITCLSTASPNFQSGDFVFRRYINETGWNNGVAWLLGLLQSE